MRLSWNELRPVQTAGPYLKEILLPVLEGASPDKLMECMAQYQKLPVEIQGGLGYTRCLMESHLMGFYSAYSRYSSEMLMHNFRKMPLMRLPIHFFGWGGMHNDIGPAYEMDAICFCGADSRVFYTGDGISCQEDAERMAEDLQRYSSGLADMRAERLDCLREMEEDIPEETWCVTFRLDDAARKEIAVNGRPLAQEAGKGCLILPQVGEYDCMLGEIVHGDPENAFILAKHSYCLK